MGTHLSTEVPTNTQCPEAQHTEKSQNTQSDAQKPPIINPVSIAFYKSRLDKKYTSLEHAIGQKTN